MLQHTPTHDATRTNRAVEEQARNPEFVNRALAQLAGLTFPAFKHNIIDHVQSIKTHDNDDEDIIALFESLDGYISFAIRTMCRRHLKKISQPRKGITR